MKKIKAKVFKIDTPQECKIIGYLNGFVIKVNVKGKS